MIDTTSSKEELKSDENIDAFVAILNELINNELSNNIGQQRDTIKTLTTIIINLISKPLDP